MQIKYVNRSLQRFDATQVIPTQFVMFTLSVILGSAILYRDFERMSADHAGKFVGGCAMTFFGVWLITSKRPKAPEDDDREQEPVDAIGLVNGERYRDSIDERSTRTMSIDQTRPTSPPIPISKQQTTHLGLPPSLSKRRSSERTTATITPSTSFPSAPTSLENNVWEDLPRTPQPPSSTEQRLVPGHVPPFVQNGLTNNASLSTPVLPTSVEATEPSTPTRPYNPRGNSDHLLNTQFVRGIPQTPPPPAPSSQTEPPAIDRTPATQERLRLSQTLSAAPLYISSPLSSSVSAVVAELRRGGSLRSTARSLRAVAAAQQQQRQRLGDEEEGFDPSTNPRNGRRSIADSATGPLRTAEASLRQNAAHADGVVVDDNGKAVRRGRSLSGALDELFKWMGDEGFDADEIAELERQRVQLEGQTPGRSEASQTQRRDTDERGSQDGRSRASSGGLLR